MVGVKASHTCGFAHQKLGNFGTSIGAAAWQGAEHHRHHTHNAEHAACHSHLLVSCDKSPGLMTPRNAVACGNEVDVLRNVAPGEERGGKSTHHRRSCQ